MYGLSSIIAINICAFAKFCVELFMYRIYFDHYDILETLPYYEEEDLQPTSKKHVLLHA